MCKHGDGTTDQYSHATNRMYKCDKEAGRSRSTPSTPALSGGDSAKARIRKEQTRMFTVAKSQYHGAQFPDQKKRGKHPGLSGR